VENFPKILHQSIFGPNVIPLLVPLAQFIVNEMKSFSQHPSWKILSFERDVPEYSVLVGCYAVLLGALIFRVKLSHLTMKMKKL